MVRKIALLALLIEVAYLLLINGALHLPLTQDLVNSLKPDKFQVHWEKAWTWYPTRIHVTGLSVDGESRSQQWQLQAADASASIALLPLIFKRVWVRNVQASDIDYRQRPKLKPNKDYSAVLPYFPEIGNRKISAAGTLKPGSPWHISVKNVQASGHHNFWVFQMRGAANGDFSGRMTAETRGGPVSLDLTHINLKLEPALFNDSNEFLSGGSLSGSLGFTPFVWKESKGVALLSYLYTDIKADINLNNLSFLDLFLLKMDGMSVNGKGRVSGSLRYNHGEVLPRTRFKVVAPDLQVRALSHIISGSGKINLIMDDDRKNEGLYLGILYQALTVHRPNGQDALLTGEGLQMTVRGNGQLMPDPDEPDQFRALELSIDALSVPKMASIQRYLPQQWPVKIHSGRGTLHGSAQIGPSSLSAEISLDSDNADLSLKDYRFTTNLDVAITLNNPDTKTHGTSVDGSHISLSDSRVSRGDNQASDHWDTRLDITQGIVSLKGDPRDRNGTEVADLIRELNGMEARSRLERIWAQLDVSASMSNLGWIAALVEPGHGVTTAGTGQLLGHIDIEEGAVAPLSKLAIRADNLAVDLLGYTSTGRGNIALQVEQARPLPEWSMSIGLVDGTLRRASADSAYIENAKLALHARISTQKGEESPIQARELDFQIDSAQVTDMKAFNSFLPQAGAARFIDGSADLSADISLRRRDAHGWLKLNSTGIKAEVGDQKISGDLVLDIRLAGGIPEDKVFDISGSRVFMNQIKVDGERAGFASAGWSARLTLDQGHAVWQEPVQIRGKGQLGISDTRPFVALFENGGWRPKFLSRLLTIEDIRGEATLSMFDNILYIEDAQVRSDKVEIRAKGSLSKTERNAMLYMRYQRLDALLKYQGKKRNLDLINAKEAYNAFRPIFPTSKWKGR